MTIPIRAMGIESRQTTSSSSDSSSANYERYLTLATESNPSMILELDLDGSIRYISPVWESIICTTLPSLHSAMADLIVGSPKDKDVFNEAMHMWSINDDVSYTIRFDVLDNAAHPLMLEACGILIHDNLSHIPTHSMWIIKPHDTSLQDDSASLSTRLPPDFIKILGFGSYIFMDYLNYLETQRCIDENNLPDPNLELCRVCELFVPDWWLESHSKSCVCEHRIQSIIQILHDSLVEHQKLLASIQQQQTSLNESFSFEYKNIPVHISKSAIQNLAELCELAIDINPSQMRSPSFSLALNTFDSTQNQGQLNYRYDFSPKTTLNIQDVSNWDIPTNTSENEGLQLLIADTVKLTSDKVDAVLRLDNAMTYSIKIKKEVNNYVFQLIREQIENNKLFISHSLGESSFISPSILSDVKLETNSVPLLTHPSFLGDVQASTPITPNYSSPQPQRPHTSSIFTDTYIDTDEIPTAKGVSARNKDSDNSIIQWSSSVENSLSRSITPKQRLEYHHTNSSIDDFLAEHRLSQPPLSSGSEGRQKSESSSLNHTPSTQSLRIINNHSSHSLSVPKMKSSIILTPRRGSPLLNSSSSSVSNATTFNQQNPSSTASKLHQERINSPINSPFSMARDFLTPEQQPTLTNFPKQPLSPLLLATNQIKTPNPNIKDYHIIKPISKGAYGSVYLAQKKLTGDYVAIKVLRKSDMIAKNQVTNVKSERAIMMVQSEKPYVARLYESFQNKDNLFLVMEYLPGGDLATVIKMMGYLPDNWAKQYISEVIIGVDDMHKNGIIHHDLKPENLLIDKDGHLKLTDFGLSRAGLVHRHQNIPSRTKQLSFSSTHSNGNSISNFEPAQNDDGDLNTTNMIIDSIPRDHERRYSNSSALSNTDPIIRRTNSSGSISIPEISRTDTPSASLFNFSRTRANSTLSESLDMNSLTDYALFHPDDSKQNKKFFGTPDYLAPETIEGTGEDDQCDWWSLGCILFELYFGYPPFHANSVDAVFQNIISGRVAWPEFAIPTEEKDYISPEAKDLISKLLVLSPSKRLGANGSQEIKDHPYFNGVDWDHVYDEEASFVPSVEDPEATDYFELRGAVLEDLGEDTEERIDIESSDVYDSVSLSKHLSNEAMLNHISNIQMQSLDESRSAGNTLNKLSISSVLESDSHKVSENCSPTLKYPPSAIPPHMRDRRFSKLNETQTEFGSFNYRNLSALDKANKDAINRLKNEHLSDYPGVHRRTSSTSIPSSSSDSSVSKLKVGRTSVINSPAGGHKHKSSITSDNCSIKSYSPDRSVSLYSDLIQRKDSAGHDSLSSPLNITLQGAESPGMKFKHPVSPSIDGTGSPFTNTPFNLRTRRSSKTASQKANLSEISLDDSERLQAISKIHSVRSRRRSERKNSSGVDEMKYHMDVLYCEPIPINRYCTTKELENIGCTVVGVGAGDELVSRATSGVKFDLIVTALKLPKLGAVDIAKLLKHTNGINSTTPIVAATIYYQEASNTNAFDDVIEKPVNLATLKRLISKYALLKSQREEESIMSDAEGL